MAPPGGSSTLYGILYQLLGSLHHTVRLLRIQRRGKAQPADAMGASLILEPPGGGGDVRIELPGERIVEQWKARTTSTPWGLQDILDKVLPDLYRDPALDLPDDQTRYVFATEGRIGLKAQSFFKRLQGAAPKRSPLSGLGKEDRKLLYATAREIRERKGARSEPVALTRQKLRRLLCRFEIRDNQGVDQLVRGIDQKLLALVDYRDDIPAVRGQLCTILLCRGTGKGDRNEFMPEDILREAGLHGVSLEHTDELRRTAREVLDRKIARRKYYEVKDVRGVPVWPEGKTVLFLSGESGQGKTWQSARLALELAKGDQLVVLVDSLGDAERDLQRASDLLWKEAWHHDLSIFLGSLVERWHQVQGETGKPWLTVCIENIQSLTEARVLLRDYDWERWGVALVLTGSPQVGSPLAEENSERVQYVRIRDFATPELREYLKRHGRSWDTVPPDVRETLQRPLLAGLYTSLGSDPDWNPTLEYDLYEKSWQKIKRDLSQNREDLHFLKRLALALLDQEPRYPWTWDQLRTAGVTSEARARLEQVGWWTQNDEGVEVWHDRMLSWAVAEAIAEQASPETLASRLIVCRQAARGTRVGRILGYVPMDVLWLLSGDPAKSRLVPDLIISMEQGPFGGRGLQGSNLPTLGLRILPPLIERLRRLPNQSRSSYTKPAVGILSSILEREPDGKEKLPPLLHDPSALVRRVAIDTLAQHPHAAAVNSLWSLLRGASLQMERSNAREGIYERQAAFKAMRACLELDPKWLRSKIKEIHSEDEPVWELAYLLANLKHLSARAIWTELKEALFEKVVHGKLNSLMACIRAFQDRDEIARLETWLSLKEKWTDNIAFEGIAWLDPDRGVYLLSTLPLRTLLDSRGAWLPILLLNRPDETRQALRERLKTSGADFWRVADLYQRHEEQIDRETVEVLLDQLATEIARDIQDADEALNRLRLPIHLLTRIHRPDLLEVFQALAGTDLDRSLGELGAAPTKVTHRDLDKLYSILLNIGGEGIRRLIRSGLASTDADRRSEAMGWGVAYPEELAAISLREEWSILAAIGEDRILVEEIITWEEEVENEGLTELWRMRRWKPPISDADLAPALEALGSADPQKRARGLAAISISGREDLLSRLPEWLECDPSLDDDDEGLDSLDSKASYVVHRFADQNPEGTLLLARSINVRRFPSTGINLAHKEKSGECAYRLASYLLERLSANQTLEITEVRTALHLAQFIKLPDPVLQAVWAYGRRLLRAGIDGPFFTIVSHIDSEEARETIWKEAFESPYTVNRINAIRALHLSEPDEAIRAASRGLSNSKFKERTSFVSLLLEIGELDAIPLLLDQAVREKSTQTLCEIARTLRRVPQQVESELRARLESPDFRVRRSAAYLAGWQGPRFLEAELKKMAAEDPDDDVQWDCLQGLARQERERCVLELMDAFRVQENNRWSYLESILELGDPGLLVTEEDPLWLGQILPPELGALQVHANFRLKQRFAEVKRAAEQRDRSQEN